MTEKEAQRFVGTYAVHQYRDWSDEHRIMHKIEAPYSLPPVHSGRRFTKHLSEAGARKLAESCEYVSSKRGGYTTFLTLTFNKKARKRLKNGGTIQQEVSRFFDGLQKMYKRGWKPKSSLLKLEGNSKPLDYLWVAEAPDSYTVFETGEVIQNPHVHVLMRWNVDYQYFKDWAERIERLWGNGFAHLEKLRSKKGGSAAAYLMKALQYVAKAASGSDQGTIYGNRYGISKSARAPGWVTLYSFAWHVAGKLIENARMKQTRNRKPLEDQREYLKQQLKAAKTGSQKNAIQRALEKCRENLEKIKGDIYYGRNRVVCKGNEAKEKFFKWMISRGFDWFDKPLSIYAEILRKKQAKIDEYHNKWQKFSDEFYDTPDWWKAYKHGGADNQFSWF